MIRIGEENLYPLKQLLSYVPPARKGKKTAMSTLVRWILKGARSTGGELVKLEATRLGNRWMASLEALQRFGERLAGDKGHPLSEAPRSPAARQKADDKAVQELRKAGIS